MTTSKNEANPSLRILLEPEDKFRFRYFSECQKGSHGCLQAHSSNSLNGKTYPTIELVNYTGPAEIKCRLWQTDKDEEHPFKVCADTSEDACLRALVTEDDGYILGFKNIRIISMSMKDVRRWLLKKLEKISSNVNTSQLNNTLHTINRHMVRLRFSAHDIASGEEICPPILSQPIRNMKSNKTNDLKICNYSRCRGRARGGDDIFLFVEEVDKKDIMVRFFELNENGKRIWTESVKFPESYVHHQYAIVIKTPPYKDLAIKSNVKVYMELMRPSDERTSEPKEFIYTPAQPLCTRCRMEVLRNRDVQTSENSSMIVPQTPTTISESSNGYNLYFSSEESERQTNHDAEESFPISNANNLDFDSYNGATPNTYDEVTSYNRALDTNTVLSKNPMIGDLNLSYPVAVRTQPEAPSYDFTRCEEVYEAGHDEDYFLTLCNLTVDSGIIKGTSSPHVYTKDKKTPVDEENIITNDIKVQINKECPAYYKAEDVVEVKKLIKHICDILQHKNGNKTQEMKSTLESLMEMRLSNGDTFLHMALSNSQQSLEYMVKLIHSMNMPQLLNLTNDLQQTILHLAVVHDLPRIVALLVAKGCDPMLVDADGNNALHYAVNRGTLAPMLEAIENNHVSYDLNAQNNEKQTALHLAAIFDSEESTRLLLDHGASIGAQDYQGRTSLHLAVYDGNLNAARVIIASTLPNDIDSVDGQGHTVLQIACEVDINNNNSLEIIKLLLEKRADPYNEPHSKPAWKLAKKNPQIWDVINKYADLNISSNNHHTNHSDDEFVSADEGDADECHVASKVH